MAQNKFSRFVANSNNIDTGITQTNLFKLDFSDLRRQGFINPTARRSLISEEIRLIKRRLFQKMVLQENDDDLDDDEVNIERDKEDISHVVQVTSSKPNEGKSFFALNLALSIAMDERYNVLLIDADITRSSLSKTLHFDDYLGLTDVLRDAKPNLKGILRRDKTYPFSFLPAGSGVASATDLFGGRKMKRIVRDIAQRYQDRIVIFDTPPLLAGTEAVVLSHHVGQVLYVVDASSTSCATIESGLSLLDDYDKVSLVLNKTPKFANSDQFGAYYEYYGKTPQ